MNSAADRGGSFGRRDVESRNWMRASAPGIAFRYPKAESSPVGGGATEQRGNRRALAWIAAGLLAVGLALTGNAAYIHAKALLAQALLHRAWM